LVTCRFCSFNAIIQVGSCAELRSITSTHWATLPSTLSDNCSILQPSKVALSITLSPLQLLLLLVSPLPQAKNHDTISPSQAKPSNRPASQELHPFYAKVLEMTTNVAVQSQAVLVL
jgi:hypothetical protein